MITLKQRIILVLTLGFIIPVSGQDATEHKNCLTYEMQEERIANNPHLLNDILQSEQELEDFTRDFISSNEMREDEEYIIPVVFHVIHNFGEENISDDQIYDQMRAFNEDFNGLNAGFNNVVEEFMDIRAVVGVQFRLAQKDPDGNCTNGIIRTQSTATYNGGENLKNISPTWDRSSYLNIWVCENIGGGTAAYTYKPASVNGANGADDDGIVCSHDYVGAIGTSSPTNAHTLSHEVGHWINLDHPWGPTNNPGQPNNCNFDDNVADTPNTIGHTSCDLNAVTCGSLDNVENIMEYAYCDKMFTEGQKTRMIASLNSSIAQRNQLWQPANLIATGTNGVDILCAADFNASKRSVCVNDSIHFEDNSYTGGSEWTWEFEGGNPAVSNLENPIVYYSEPGVYPVSLSVSNGDDTVTEVKESYIKVLPSNSIDLPFSEDFESEEALSGFNWQVENPDGQFAWELNDDASVSGDYSAKINGRTNFLQATEGLASPTIDLSDMTENPVLTFKFAHTVKFSNTTDDVLYVMVSNDCGENWFIRKIIASTAFNSAPPTTSSFVPADESQWIETSVTNITDDYWVENFRFKFEFRSNAGNNLYIDDVNLSLPPSTGIDENNLLGAFNVYPNPTNDQFNLELDIIKNSQLDVSIIDVLGKEVKNIYQGSNSSGNFRRSVNVKDMDAGVYLIRVIIDNEIAVKRIIVE